MTIWNDAATIKPELGEIVIVLEGISTWYGYYNESTDKWYDDNFCSDMKVSHWAKFPEPPQLSEIK